jgi:CheY-like chemotaxis protein
MTSNTPINSNIRLVLLDDDSIFRLGLATLLESAQFTEISIIAQGKLTEALELLEANMADLLVISVDLATYPPKISNLIALTSQLEQKYPNLPLLILTPWGSNETIQAFNNVKGCCGRNIEVNQLVEAIRVCARGETYFVKTDLTPQPQIIGGWLYRQGQLGLKQISEHLSEIESILAQRLSTLDLIYWQGRKRELKVARWLIKQILPENIYSSNYGYEAPQPNLPSAQETRTDLGDSSAQNNIVLSADKELTTYELTLAKIQSSVKNCTNLILEIDILKEETRKELIILILDEFIKIITEIKKIQLNQEQLVERKEIFLKDLWQNSTIKFLSRYLYQQNNNYNLVDLVLKEAPTIMTESLDKIPLVINLLKYSVLKLDIAIDHQIYPYNSESAQEIEAILLDNLIISIANTTMQFILNQFYDEQIIKHNLFDLEWKSSRKIAMFRNNLVWKYRREKYWQIPKNIFEDEYLLLRLGYQGIVICKVTHPRHQELKEIKGIPWAVTILIEFRDSISRGVKAIGDILGKTIVYLLTEIIGKGIGLIGRGIVKGIGSKIKT